MYHKPSLEACSRLTLRGLLGFGAILNPEVIPSRQPFMLKLRINVFFLRLSVSSNSIQDFSIGYRFKDRILPPFNGLQRDLPTLLIGRPFHEPI